MLLAAVIAVLVLSRGREPRSEYVGEASAGLVEQAHTDAGGGTNQEEAGAREAEEEEQHDAPTPDDADDDPLGAPAPEHAVAMTVVVRTGARIAALILTVAGFYLFALGYTPGGGFPGRDRGRWRGAVALRGTRSPGSCPCRSAPGTRTGRNGRGSSNNHRRPARAVVARVVL